MPDSTDRDDATTPEKSDGMEKTGGYRPLNEGYRPVPIGDGYQPKEDLGYTPAKTETTSQLPTPPKGGSGESGPKAPSDE